MEKYKGEMKYKPIFCENGNFIIQDTETNSRLSCHPTFPTFFLKSYF